MICIITLSNQYMIIECNIYIYRHDNTINPKQNVIRHNLTTNACNQRRYSHARNHIVLDERLYIGAGCSSY